MKYTFVFILFLLTSNFSYSQEKEIDSLYQIINKEGISDTSKILIETDIAQRISYSNPDSAKRIVENTLKRSLKLQFHSGVEASYSEIFFYYYFQGNFQEAVKVNFKCLEYFKKNNKEDFLTIVKLHNRIGISYRNQGAYSKALEHHFKGLKILENK